MNLNQVEKFCVFQCGENWFAVPSLAVRCVLPRPTVTTIPHSDPTLKGVCHIQNEFIPVLSLRAIIDVQYETTESEEQQLMIMMGPQGSWGLIIDQAVGLAALETSFSAESNRDDALSQIITGSASYSNHVLQVLDVNAIYRYASSLLNMYWQDTNDIATPAN